jgi:tetratricopeptide (TPR) repeat protein
VPIPGVEAESLRDALDDLTAYSLVARDAEEPFFLVHRLVQDVTRRAIAGAARHQRLAEALGWVDAAFTGDAMDVRNWPRIDPLAPHARAITTHADTAGIFEPTARLMSELGRFLEAKALQNEAEPLLRRALAIDEKNLGSDHPTVGIRLNNVASLLRHTSRLAEAEPLMRRVISIFEKNLGQEDHFVATALSNLAGLLHNTNRLDEAEPLRRRALAIDEKNFGHDHPEVAVSLNNLAHLLTATKRFAEAEPLFRRAIAIGEASFGPDHPKVAIRLNNLAQLLHETNRFAEAEPLMRRALTIDEKSFGMNHPSVAIRLNNLAGLLHITGRLAEAEPLMRRHVVILLEFTRRTGHSHPHLEAAFQNYALLLEAMDKSPTEIEAAIKTLMDPSSP